MTTVESIRFPVQTRAADTMAPKISIAISRIPQKRVNWIQPGVTNLLGITMFYIIYFSCIDSKQIINILSIIRFYIVYLSCIYSKHIIKVLSIT